MGIRLVLLGTLLNIALLAGLFPTAGPAQATTTFVVRNTNDSGPDSLRAAILGANAPPTATRSSSTSQARSRTRSRRWRRCHRSPSRW